MGATVQESSHTYTPVHRVEYRVRAEIEDATTRISTLVSCLALPYSAYMLVANAPTNIVLTKIAFLLTKVLCSRSVRSNGLVCEWLGNARIEAREDARHLASRPMELEKKVTGVLLLRKGSCNSKLGRER